MSRAAAALLLLFCGGAAVVVIISCRDLETAAPLHLQLETTHSDTTLQIRRDSEERRLSLSLSFFKDPKSSSLRSESTETSTDQGIWFSRWRNKDMYAELKEKQQIQQRLNAEVLDSEHYFQPLSICGRQTNVGTTQDLALLEKYNMENTCPGANSKKLLLLQGGLAHGRTGNNLIEFLHALQIARDMDYQLAITSNSWVFELLHKMWFNSIHDDDWAAKFEKAFCIKIFQPDESTKGWDRVPHKLNPNNSVIISKYLFNYQSELPLDEYIASQSRFIQMLFRHYNTAPDDMCSGINAIFGEERSNVRYSVLHNRHLEGAPGIRLMQRMSRGSGCHPTAALEMHPEYIKSILEPIGMLDYPIVLITDGQDPAVAQRLLEDPEIGPMLSVMPQSASWIGGDLTAAIMSDVFIGNPASSFSGFIAKARIAMGFGNNHLFRAKVSTGVGKPEWVTTCGDACIYDKNILGNMS